MFQSLFIHWPFHTLPLNNQLVKAYNQALCAEIRRIELNGLKAIFIGGKAPNTWSKQYLLDTSGTLSIRADFNKNIEYTLEVDPLSTPRDQNFDIWKSIGINRLCIKLLLQKGNPELNRALQIVKQAHTVFQNLSLDIYIRSFRDWKMHARTIVTLPIQHISLDTRFCKEKTFVEWYAWTCKYFENHGFKRYEFLHFSRSGFESQYQLSSWDRKPSKGCGNGAWTFDGNVRTKNETNLMKYISQMKDRKNPAMFTETLTEKEVFVEKMLCGLRTRSGVSLNALTQHLCKEEQKRFFKTVTHLKKEQFVAEKNEMISLTIKGLMVEQRIIAALTC